MIHPTWGDYFMGFAVHAATKSKDLSTKVGCVIVGPDGEVRATGFNGIPRGVQDIPERLERPAKYLWTSHAEENAVAHAARVGTPLAGCKVFATHYPCSRCARMLIQAGVREVYFGDYVLGMKHHTPEEFEVARIMFEEAKVEVIKIGEAAV